MQLFIPDTGNDFWVILVIRKDIYDSVKSISFRCSSPFLQTQVSLPTVDDQWFGNIVDLEAGPD